LAWLSFCILQRVIYCPDSKNIAELSAAHHFRPRSSSFDSIERFAAYIGFFQELNTNRNGLIRPLRERFNKQGMARRMSLSRVMRSTRRSQPCVKIDVVPIISTTKPVPPVHWSKSRAMDWVREVLVRTRGKELPGNFNPLLVGELFWEQSSKWQKMAEHHIEDVADVCSQNS